MTTLPILNEMPSGVEFYTRYWGQSPFVVRGAIAVEVMEALIGGDELAALACEETVRSRLVFPPLSGSGEDSAWSCQFGPFEDQDFRNQTRDSWSLLVQNVEQYHPETAVLLQHFEFSPRWLLDDIMVSYATPGGSVGPHMDSYHVFLVQGMGQRQWKIGQSSLVLQDEIYIKDLDIRVLRDGFEGDKVTVSCGDVVYIPPRFAHDGITLKNSLTYSIGFLGPKLSDLFMAYGQYLRELDSADQPYAAGSLCMADSGFFVSPNTLLDIQTAMMTGIQNQCFGQWLAEFFAGSSSEYLDDSGEREDVVSCEELLDQLSGGGQLIKPPYVKLVVVRTTSGDFHLGFAGQMFQVSKALSPVVDILCGEQPFSTAAFEGNSGAVSLVTELYNQQILEKVDD